MTQYSKRNKEIIDLRRSGKTLGKIGKKFAISRERVRQILNFSEEGIEANFLGKIALSNKRLEKRLIKCQYCGIHFLPNTSSKKKYCSPQCSGKGHKKPIGNQINPYTTASKEGQKWRYEMKKKYKPEILKKYSDTAKENIRKDPERNERYKKYHSQWAKIRHLKRKADPKKYQEYLEKCRNKYHEMMKDPIKSAKRKRQDHIRYYLRKIKNESKD